MIWNAAVSELVAVLLERASLLVHEQRAVSCEVKNKKLNLNADGERKEKKLETGSTRLRTRLRREW